MRCVTTIVHIKFQKLLQAVTIPRCISTLGLRPSNTKHLQSGQMLEDTHTMAAQNSIWLYIQFPQFAVMPVNTSLSK